MPFNAVLSSGGLGSSFSLRFLSCEHRQGVGFSKQRKSFIEKVLALSDQGAGFIFGKLANGSAVNYVDAATGDPASIGMVFAFQILPTVIFFGALMSVLYHLGIIQALVRAVAAVMSRTMGTSGAESLSAAGNIFVGQTESPLIIKPYVNEMTRSELMAVMCGGSPPWPGRSRRVCKVRNRSRAPSRCECHECASCTCYGKDHGTRDPALGYSRWLNRDFRGGDIEYSRCSRGRCLRRMSLALNVAAMLIAFISLVAMVDWMLASLGGLIGFDALSLKWIFGWVFYPLSFCMGVDTQDLHAFGQLLGSKIAVNEFVAYIDLGNLSATMTERSTIIGTYASADSQTFHRLEFKSVG